MTFVLSRSFCWGGQHGKLRTRLEGILTVTGDSDEDVNVDVATVLDATEVTACLGVVGDDDTMYLGVPSYDGSELVLSQLDGTPGLPAGDHKIIVDVINYNPS